MSSIDQLRAIDIFDNLSDEDLGLISKYCVERKAKKNSYIINAKEADSSVMFLIDGEVKITLVSDDAKEAIITLLGRGDFFGELAVLTGADRCANAYALTDCRYLSLSAKNFKALLKESTAFTEAIILGLAIRLRVASEKIGSLALLDVSQRLCKVLKALSTRESDMFIIEKRPTHQDLAAMIGTSREMVTRALKELEGEQHIKIDGKSIKIYSLPS